MRPLRLVRLVASPGLRIQALEQIGKGRIERHAAAEHEADLLVIGNKGMNRRVLGSVPRRVCQRAPCSVVVAKTT